MSGQIRLLLSDVDGTLINPDKELTAASIRAVHELRDAGITFAITSARPPRGLIRFVEPLALTTPLGAFNGGAIVNGDLTVIEERSIDEEIVGVSDDADASAAAWSATNERFTSRVSATRSQTYYLDVTNPDANKGGVVDYLAKRYDIAPQEIATIGDMHNDVAMFQASGFSVAMGNADSAVQRAAHVVTTTNAEEGFARAVADFILS